MVMQHLLDALAVGSAGSSVLPITDGKPETKPPMARISTIVLPAALRLVVLEVKTMKMASLDVASAICSISSIPSHIAPHHQRRWKRHCLCSLVFAKLNLTQT